MAIQRMRYALAYTFYQLDQLDSDLSAGPDQNTRAGLVLHAAKAIGHKETLKCGRHVAKPKGSKMFLVRVMTPIFLIQKFERMNKHLDISRND